MKLPEQSKTDNCTSKQLIFLLLIFTITTIFSCQTSVKEEEKQGFLKVEGQKIVDHKGENVILRGYGLGGWMLQEGYMLRLYRDGQQHKIRERIEALIGPDKTREFYDTWLANHVTKTEIDSLKAWGFNSVRLPMHYNLYTLPIGEEPAEGEQTWLKKGFEMTDSLLSWCEANEMYLILDLHAAPGGQGTDVNISDRDPEKPSLWDSEENKRKTIAFWKKLAERYADEPWIGGYDIINEPNWGFTDYESDPNGLQEENNEPLRKLMMDITTAIREVDTNHIIIIEGNGWGNNYRGVLPLWDDNMVISFHKYWNYNRQAEIQWALDMREEQNAPIWLGETGENSNVWFTQAIALVESHNIGWAWWPLKKVGFNNPWEIPMTPGYERLLDYWSGEGEKPSESEAYEIIMELADNAKMENCLYHKDVVDAMIRQPFTTETKPFNIHEFNDELEIKAVDYDLGRNGYAYYDTDTANYYISTGGDRTGWNLGRTYRNDGVDISMSDDGSYHVDHFVDGEWLQYSVVNSVPRNVHILLSTKSIGGTSIVSLKINGEKIAENVIPITDDKGLWEEVTFENVELSEGTNEIRIKVEQGDIHFKSLIINRQ